jgi:hypothetical protein
MTRNPTQNRVCPSHDGRLNKSGGWKASTAVSALFISLVAGGVGCGSGSAKATDSGTQNRDAAVAVGAIVRGPMQPCTEAHTICVAAKFPASMTTQATKLQIDLYIIVPPMDPPDGVPVIIETPQLSAGETVQLRMSDLGLAGNYHFLGLLFMPGGGFALPVTGVDYIGDSVAAYPFTGVALNVPETLDFQFAR